VGTTSIFPGRPVLWYSSASFRVVSLLMMPS
jgi:hypothetical protein